MKKGKILFLGPKPQLLVVRQCLPEFEVIYCIDSGAIDQLLPEVVAILDAYMKVQFPKDRLEKAENLRLITTATTGANHIDQRYLQERNIPLWTLKGQEHITKNVTPAAELTWLLLLAVARQFKPAIAEPISGGWERNKFPGWMLRGRTIGIVGCGRIGGWVARYAEAFGMKILGYDPYKEELDAPFQKRVLDELLEESDVVSVHVHLNEETTNLLNAAALKRMKAGAILINTSRGEVIDESALLAGLKSGHLRGAGLDVLIGEPNIEDHPLVQYARNNDNLIITPHIGGFSPDALNMILEFSCNRIINFFNE